MSDFTHVDATGRVRMVDISAKAVSDRHAVAGATLQMAEATLRAIAGGETAKGDIFATARIAGILAAKRTHELIPLCHPLALNDVGIDFELDPSGPAIHVRSRCRVSGRTGVEMEALTAAAVAALTLYDMCKALDRGMRITDVRVIEKAGGRSGDFRAEP
ncbi:MAG: cyclic pyranopterin monophosphate synthase MoaC [Rhodospirillales bacterium]